MIESMKRSVIFRGSDKEDTLIELYKSLYEIIECREDVDVIRFNPSGIQDGINIHSFNKKFMYRSYSEYEGKECTFEAIDDIISMRYKDMKSGLYPQNLLVIICEDINLIEDMGEYLDWMDFLINKNDIFDKLDMAILASVL